MSKTDKTRPFIVRLWDRADLTRVAVHDHRDGGCDLPASCEEDLQTDWAYGECRWEFVYTGRQICCCEVCGGGPAKRRGRRAWRRRANQMLRSANLDDESAWEDAELFIGGPRTA